MVGLGILSGLSNYGPEAIRVGMLVALGLFWRLEVKPTLTSLKTTQQEHGDELESRALDNRERDILLDDAHDRHEQAKEARKSLRQRLEVLEHEVLKQHPEVDLEPTARGGGGSD